MIVSTRVCASAWLLQEVVWPALGSDPQGLVYQAVPTFRCHLPGTGRPLIRKHNDVNAHNTQCTALLRFRRVAHSDVFIYRPFIDGHR